MLHPEVCCFTATHGPSCLCRFAVWPRGQPSGIAGSARSGPAMGRMVSCGQPVLAQLVKLYRPGEQVWGGVRESQEAGRGSRESRVVDKALRGIGGPWSPAHRGPTALVRLRLSEGPTCLGFSVHLNLLRDQPQRPPRTPTKTEGGILPFALCEGLTVGSQAHGLDTMSVVPAPSSCRLCLQSGHP